MSKKLTSMLGSVLKRIQSTPKKLTASDVLAAIRLQPLAGQLYLPWTASSMSPTAIAILINDIEVNGRTTVVECGSGISTFFLAKALSKKETARLVTIDHDENFLATVRSWIMQAGCGHCVDFVYAPIETLPGSIGKGVWYSTKLLDHFFDDSNSSWGGKAVDMLVVDGPPAWEQGKERARLPAAFYFQSRLSESCSIFLDDIGRKGERYVAHAWEKALDIKIFKVGGASGIGYGRRGDGYTIV